MRTNRIFHVLKVLLIVTVAINVFGVAVMGLWNWLMPVVFKLPAISFGQAIGLVLLSKILLSGFRPPWAGRRRWRQHMEERWAQMTAEERERFRAGMRGRCGWGRGQETAPEQKSV
jgi:hypothetical protein